MTDRSEMSEVLGSHRPGSPTGSSLYGTHEEPLEGFGQRTVTENDFAAYAKEDFSADIQKKIVNRLFNSLDPLNKEAIQAVHLDQLLKRMGDELTEEQRQSLFSEVFPEGGAKVCTFETFYAAWGKLTLSASGAKKFALVSADFQNPYQQQQLFTKETGEKFTSDYRVSFFFKNLETDQETAISPWHDIPLMVKDIIRTQRPGRDNRYNFICEIPKWTRAKFEVATKEPFNPIKQDIKNAQPRFYKHGDMLFNYGCFPQTWESPEHQWPGTNAFGDNDPMDAIEIGMTQLKTGSVTQVKVLGILGMIDAGEMDWKVIVIQASDPVARFLQDIADVPKYLPGALESLREWLRAYKICQEGKPNEFAFGGDFKDKAFAKKVIGESYLMWCNLRKIQGTSKLSENT